MSSKIFEQRGKVALLAGLQWRVLTKSGKARVQDIRTHASDLDATKVVVVATGDTAEDRASVGLYSAADSDLEDRSEADDSGVKIVKPKVLHSLAALFAERVGAANAVLALSLPMAPGSVLSQAIVIVVDAGVPLSDDVKSTDDAVSLAMNYATGGQSYPYDLYTNDLTSFAAGQLFDVEDLWNLASKKSQLVARPANIKGALAFATVILLIAGGSYAGIQYKAAADRQVRLRAAKAADPTPKYNAALAESIGHIGMDRVATQALIKRMLQQPLWVEGWLLARLECNATTSSCVATWARAGGTTDALIAARKPAGEEIMGDSTQDVVRMTYKVETPTAGIGSRSQLPTQEELAIGVTPTLQIWDNAGIVATTPGDGYKVWPQVPGVEVNNVSADLTVKSRAIVIKTVPMLLAEVVETAPANFWWQNISFDVKVSGKSSELLAAELKGNSYVR